MLRKKKKRTLSHNCHKITAEKGENGHLTVIYDEMESSTKRRGTSDQ